MSELVIDEVADLEAQERKQIIRRIGKNAGRLSEIINGLLAYSRIDEEIEDREIDLNDISDRVREALSLTINEKNVLFTNDKLPAARGATLHFVQLLQNLVANAIKYARNEQPRVHPHLQ